MSENSEQAGDVAGPEDQRVMGLLSEHVPLSLLVDLADPQGPASDEILKAEGLPDDAWWVQDGVDLSAADEIAAADRAADDEPSEDA